MFEFAVDEISGSMESISHANMILGGALESSAKNKSTKFGLARFSGSQLTDFLRGRPRISNERRSHTSISSESSRALPFRHIRVTSRAARRRRCCTSVPLGPWIPATNGAHRGESEGDS